MKLPKLLIETFLPPAMKASQKVEIFMQVSGGLILFLLRVSFHWAWVRVGVSVSVKKYEYDEHKHSAFRLKD